MLLGGIPGVDGGGIPPPVTPGVETAWLAARGVLCFAAGRIAGEFRPASSFFTTATFDGVGDGTPPDMLRERSSWTRFGAGVAEEDVPPKGFLRDPLAGVPFAPFVGGAGDPGLALLPNFKVIFGAGSGILSLIFGAEGSGTACLASRNNLLKCV